MGTLALDIETASPFEEPDRGDNDTRFYEWVSVGLAYSDDALKEPDTAVLFRRGGWEAEHTADLFHRMIDWCDGRDIEQTLTYNGAYFDLKHLLNWAEELDESEETTGLMADLKASCPGHIDLAKAATARHEDELREGQPILPDFIAYDLENIDNDSVWYNDYNFDEDYWERLGIEDKFVQGSHVGQVLGEKYVEGVVAGLEETKTHNELERLLYDYSISDIADLFSLYDSLGGEQLESDFLYPVEEVDR